MGFFTRNKGKQPDQQSPPPPPQQQSPGPSGGQGAQLPRPPTFLSVKVPQPQPSPAQYQQELFRRQYDYLQGQLYGYGPSGGPLPPYAQPLHADYDALNIAAGPESEKLGYLRQAVREAAKDGRPLTLNFVAKMDPVMYDNPYGVHMPHMHPYGPPFDPSDPGFPPGWYPGKGQDPYEAIRIPALPDMRDLPPELQDFRDQCATGVRQAVSMVTAMEHQLWWERSRRQQAEEDCKVLLAAVQMERGVGDTLIAAEERRRAEAVAAAGKLRLAADELPQASEAATTIQRHFRGRMARKEFESHLRDILRGVDPLLDPAALPARAQEHISNVNATGAPKRVGLRELMDHVIRKSAGGTGDGADQVDATMYYRRQEDRIRQRLAGFKDAGEPNPNDPSGDPLQADVKQLLAGSYPASSAQVIGALVRRCRELQAALLEASGELEEAKLTIKGLTDANGKLSELSHVRADLEATRHDNQRLAATVAKLRTHLTAAAVGANTSTARENPFVAAWYRKAYADQEWQKIPPGGPGGVALMDGPDTAVETWDDLRASIPEPVMVPRVTSPGTLYKDLLGLKQDMIMGAAQGPANPLYSMPVPDRSAFVYERDTPLMPMQSAAPLIRENLPPDTFLGLHDDIYRRHPSRPSGAGSQGPYPPNRDGPSAGGSNMLPSSAIHNQYIPGRTPSQGSMGGGSAGRGGGGSAYQQLVAQQERMRQQAEFEAARNGGVRQFAYNRDTPLVPVYSVKPLIREDEFMRRSLSPQRETPSPSTPQFQPSYSMASQQGPHPRIAVRPLDMTTNLQYIHDRVPPAPPPEAVAAAAVAYTRPQSSAGSGVGGGGGGMMGGAGPMGLGAGPVLGAGMVPGMGPGLQPVRRVDM